ncbi:TlyA family RNA methyltransferase [Bacteriovorax sp. PP10]|jgi:23S rRNA (cytidine1920-2'-O)/16S rRNA (cytidine1409-2'-O)-methyltransferase|uniref:TlyA family RNA methyltransferase n=1 Tax=Bacteriovorax antarcticus TaxID=3088717 RepID=A0ABU5VPY7_9BACT|nr:TlyA family RNA methyltransferase [Bacteriovorax sp. PP10]MEA9355105.1 TlyA family RNA methyltransferase [Bacteriovorax sp. PP10]
MSKDRVDKMLVEAKLTATRSQALLLIEEGVVFYQNKLVEKASQQVTAEGLEVRKEIQYVSRGAHKIEGALARFQVDVKDLVVADVGASTGGFTDYVLRNGATKVYCLDVGHDQLAQSLREDPRVENHEGVNIKFPFEIKEKVDLAVVDLSFISLKLVLKNIFDLVKPKGKIVALLKPQFEVGQSGLDGNGIVKSEGHRLVMLHEIKEWCKAQGFVLVDQCESPILGKNGNKEYFFYFDKGRS